MKHLEDLLLLGDSRLYEVCDPVTEEDRPNIQAWVNDLHNVMEEIRGRYLFGRGIAAPQLGIMKRLFYLNVDQPRVIINPQLTDLSEARFTLWDDCMSFPNLLVHIERHESLTLSYLDENWTPHSWNIDDRDVAELVQHEYDHLEGILCTMRAVDGQSFRWRPTP
uniref:Peptide deformylase n=1 Tax=Roseihalotalea indica TaxID=2867963 RepID=A0AA49GS50_9BACT|nr:peptide deformylase [Tunicatimonas sp. TK19036]